MFLFPHEIWTLRGVVLLELILIMILTTVVALQHRKLSGMLLLDLNKRRAAKRKMKKATRNESTDYRLHELHEHAKYLCS